ncbi:uncharacterized protein LOC144130074 [Amblyomma americanum]|uniref:Transcription factor TFIIIB component B'' Myb domain-containing protein n=1 Tax=Amblyomma americanum TaxID=6943 RepID=A0AAQ4D2F6_AMBAM
METRRPRLVAKPCVSRESDGTAAPRKPQGAGKAAAGVSVASASALRQVSKAVELPQVTCVHKPSAEQLTYSPIAGANVTGAPSSGGRLGKSPALSAVIYELDNHQTVESSAPPTQRFIPSAEPQTGCPQNQTWNAFHLKPGKPAARCSKMSMVDFIYYNPPGQPMSQNNTAGPRCEERNMSQRHERSSGGKEGIPEPTIADKRAEPGIPFDANDETTLGMWSPIVCSTDSTSTTAVENTGGGSAGCSPFHKQAPKERRWNAEQTAGFYRALSVYGTDFTLMTTAFPKRSRLNLKNKFIQEERQHRELVQRILAEPIQFDTVGVQRDIITPNEPKREISPAGGSPTRVDKDELQRKKMPSKTARSDGN